MLFMRSKQFIIKQFCRFLLQHIYNSFFRSSSNNNFRNFLKINGTCRRIWIFNQASPSKTILECCHKCHKRSNTIILSYMVTVCLFKIRILLLFASLPKNLLNSLNSHLFSFVAILPTPGEAKAKAMPGRLYIDTKINNNN